jgi:Cu(I)/Ag(I) efflux system membrane protein CusA/SilA
MIGSAIVALFIVPMLLRSLMKGKLIPESRNPVANFFIKIYSPVLRLCQRWKKTVIAISVLIVLGSIPFVLRLGSEFMPPLDEGSLLFMPVTFPMFPTTKPSAFCRCRTNSLNVCSRSRKCVG